MPEVVVIGFGNSLRQDDGFGPLVVERAEVLLADSRVEFLACPTLTPELAETLSHCRHAILIDASAELGPGVVARRKLQHNATPQEVSLVHFLSPEALLNWTERLYGRVPEVELWLVGSEATGLSESLTDTVAARVPEFLDALRVQIDAWLSGPTGG